MIRISNTFFGCAGPISLQRSEFFANRFCFTNSNPANESIPHFEVFFQKQDVTEVTLGGSL